MLLLPIASRVVQTKVRRWACSGLQRPCSFVASYPRCRVCPIGVRKQLCLGSRRWGCKSTIRHPVACVAWVFGCLACQKRHCFVRWFGGPSLRLVRRVLLFLSSLRRQSRGRWLRCVELRAWWPAVVGSLADAPLQYAVPTRQVFLSALKALRSRTGLYREVPEPRYSSGVRRRNVASANRHCPT